MKNNSEFAIQQLVCLYKTAIDNYKIIYLAVFFMRFRLNST